MSFIKTAGKYFSQEGRIWYPVGVNYMPRYKCGNWFEDWRGDEITADLDRIAELGLNCVRTPVFWSYYEPEPGKFNERCIEQYRMFIDLCRAREIRVMPFFLVGICTNYFPPPYSFGESMYEGRMLELECEHISSFVSYFRDEEYIFCWDLSDEPYYVESVPGHNDPNSYGYRLKSKTEVAVNWVASLASALRKTDPNHPVTIGFDNSSVQIYNGFENEELAGHLDVMSHAIYLCPSAEEPAMNLYPGFTSRLYDVGLPVFLHEGPGISQSMVDHETLEGRFRIGLYASFAAGSCGVIPWCFSDYLEEIRTEPPLENMPHEAVFGIVDSNRRNKPQADILKEFADFVRNFDWGNYEVIDNPAAIVYPKRFYERVQRERLFPRLFYNYLLIAGAGINADLWREDYKWEKHRLVVFPIPGLITSSTWKRAKKFVEKGGTLVVNGSEVVFPDKELLFGADIKGRIKSDVSSTLKLTVSGSEIETGLHILQQDIPLMESHGAEEFARVGELPVGFENKFGHGRTFWSGIDPAGILSSASLYREGISTTLSQFRQKATESGYRFPIQSLTDWIEVRHWKGKEPGTDLFFIINPLATPVNASFRVAPNISGTVNMKSGQPVGLDEIVLQPWEVLIVLAEFS